MSLLVNCFTDYVLLTSIFKSDIITRNIFKNIKTMESKLVRESSLLVQESSDIEIFPRIILEEEYLKFFGPWDRGDMIFPAISPLFQKLLKQSSSPGKTILRTFVMKQTAKDPKTFFDTLGQDPIDLVIDAQAIMQYFLERKDFLKEYNWFVIKKDPGLYAVEDLSIIKITKMPNGKFFISDEDGYSNWSMMGGYIQEISLFIAPVIKAPSFFETKIFNETTWLEILKAFYKGVFTLKEAMFFLGHTKENSPSVNNEKPSFEECKIFTKEIWHEFRKGYHQGSLSLNKIKKFIKR